MFDFLSTHDFPYDLMQRASLRGRDYAWPQSDIPRVIRHVQDVDGLNLGGHLQFRLPNGPTCEVDEIRVDTASTLDRAAVKDRSRLSAEAALRQFHALSRQFDFVVQGRAAHGPTFDKLGATDADLKQAMCFAWYARDAKDKRR
ncbi:hypothetical protein PARPLA_03202 [Rhodobacteraceae bacterium THAF1]|uniref:hypothetical protein n=1 Tax=Palleronia sp. THAF1 TaxID=2587842 RepID=UPI000F41F1C3|nr:hypothetical protein [Palleronia sp. THAF1]QFU08606.1 hypothetical protein FIU81_07965 [Palleronia sp. THAF1]VDC30709.1 hypothetical protein PARPLA_03202 [Rhodobacteraceae bacterium THAF1]